MMKEVASIASIISYEFFETVRENGNPYMFTLEAITDAAMEIVSSEEYAPVLEEALAGRGSWENLPIAEQHPDWQEYIEVKAANILKQKGYL